MSILSDFLEGQPAITLVKVVRSDSNPPMRITRHYEDVISRGHRYLALPFDVSMAPDRAISIKLEDSLGLLPMLNGAKVFIETVIDSDLDSVIEAHGPLTFHWERQGEGALVPDTQEFSASNREIMSAYFTPR